MISTVHVCCLGTISASQTGSYFMMRELLCRWATDGYEIRYSVINMISRFLMVRVNASAIFPFRLQGFFNYEHGVPYSKIIP